MCKAQKRVLAILLTIVFIATSIFTVPLVADAASTFTKITSSTRIDSKYSFSPRWISGKTYMEPFGDTAKYSYAEDLWNLEGGGSRYGTINSNWYYPVRLTSASQKGKMGVWYRNVGEYQGKMLDMKFTIVDWSQIRINTVLTSSAIPGGSKVSHTTIFFGKTDITLHTISGYMKKPKFRLEFFDKQGNSVAISGHNTFKDIDDAQFYIASTDVHGYLASNTKLTASGNRVQSPSGGAGENDKPNWLTITYDNKTAIDFVFNNNLSENENFSTVKRKTRGLMVIIFDGDTLAPFTTPAPTKTGTAVSTPGGTVSYNVAFTVPQQPAGYLYSKFVLSDTLPSGLKYTGFSVKDDTGANVTGNFTGQISGQTFTLTPNNLSSSAFFFKGYTVTINTTVEDKDFASQQGSNGKVILQNKATITAKNSPSVAEETKTSNVVNTEIVFKVNTSTDGNGTITQSESGISGGSNKTITMTPKAGYIVDTVTVDGEDKGNIGTYTFSDISENHDISATFTPRTDNKVTLYKRISKDDVNMAHGTPTAIFKLEGTDLNGKNHTYYKTLMLDESTLYKDEYYIGSVTFENIVSGTYTATEVDTSRYDLVEVQSGDNATVSGTSIVCDLVNGNHAYGFFFNAGTQIQYFSHNDILYNQLVVMQQ